MIKFRAYDKEWKRWILPKDITFYGDDGWCFDRRADTDGDIIETTTLEGGEINLMQFTGLKDKNGKEIYEGDIVRLRCGGADSVSSRHRVIAVIKWRERMFVSQIIDKKIIVRGGSQHGKKHSLSEIHSWCGMHDCFTQGWGYMEIIGNIHENPELLK